MFTMNSPPLLLRLHTLLLCLAIAVLAQSSTTWTYPPEGTTLTFHGGDIIQASFDTDLSVDNMFWQVYCNDGTTSISMFDEPQNRCRATLTIGAKQQMGTAIVLGGVSRSKYPKLLRSHHPSQRPTRAVVKFSYGLLRGAG